MLNLNFVAPKGTSLREIASYEPSCVKINSVVFPVEDGKKKGKGREGKERHKSHTGVIFHLFVGKPPANGFSPNFAHREICQSNHLCTFWCGKIKGFGIYRGSNFGVSH